MSSARARSGVAAMAAAAAAFLAVPADASNPGGGYGWATGEGRVGVASRGLGRLDFHANLRVTCHGAWEDLAGSGTVALYDEQSVSVLGEFGVEWAATPKTRFLMAPSTEDLAGFVAGRLDAAVNEDMDVVVARAGGKGVLPDSWSSLQVAFKASGTVSIGGGKPRAFRIRMKGT